MPSDWDDISFVISSRYRIAVLRRLSEGPATPSQIATEQDFVLSHASRALQELRDESFVELLVSEDKRKGRIYALTAKGEEVWAIIEERGLA